MSLPSTASKAEVHTAWLAAGGKGDAAPMRELHSQFPEWLDFNQQVGHDTSDSESQRLARFCSWGDFHLHTIGASALHTAAWGGELDIVEFLLELGQDPNAADDSGMTAIMVAILHLNLLTMRCVFRGGEAVRRNTVVDCREEQGERVRLVLAVIKILLQFGADVDARSKDGKSALHCSTSDDAYDVAKMLLDAGASIDALDEHGKTPLHYCVQEGGLLVTELLLSRGANIDVEDKDGVSPLTLVLKQSNLNVLQLFLNHHHWVSTPQRHDFAAAVLLEAVEHRDEAVVRYVVENEYASVAARNTAGETPLHRAILRRSPSLMELLADLDPAGDALTAATTESKTPAHYAAQHGSHREVEMLLRCLTSTFGDLQELGPANPLNTADGSGRTSLFTAAMSRQCSQNPEARTGPANHAAQRAIKVRLLLHHGAQLFPPSFLEQKLAPGNTREASRVILPVQVQRCLRSWLLEDGPPADEPENEEAAHIINGDARVEALTELCSQWMASVVCAGLRASLLPILICAGYAHDVMPLLVELPVQRNALPTLLRQLDKLARHQLCHPLLLQLHDELQESCQDTNI
ncbi:hypothetical protein PF010_g22573 [Phytophthora fragariae]|uniref:Uncharacterized protein n=1 Tax=Phytophthora fragariae TaxID=53985 RepID=A0A6A3IPY7_9STRA|nr:hypothetical protein PF011_g21957 [Phytophthora fragariae]KAE9079949.1 hypothetical protein PF010_g22573 [Phytophthora fragariae]KAE9190299.1 hypothetical protein PF004_g21947 [Phytophthora fragariae]KAE9292808.1 hypothetical protein PF008_g24967 [Phytophthora fragariae]